MNSLETGPQCWDEILQSTSAFRDVKTARHHQMIINGLNRPWQSGQTEHPLGCIMVKRLFITCRDALESKGIKEDSSDYPQSPRANSAPPPHW
jgi:hypothetical protein